MMDFSESEIMVAVVMAMVFSGMFWMGYANYKRHQRIARYHEWEEKMFAEEKERDRAGGLSKK